MANGLLNSEFNINLRKSLLRRNLFTPNSPYDLNNPALVETINTIAHIVSPGNSFDITNTIIGRSLGIGPQTPLVQIGNRELARQVARNVAFFAVREVLPQISPTNLFDNDPKTKLFTSKDDYQITVVEGQTKLGRFLQEITGVQPLTSPFNRGTSNIELIQNTGKGQLISLAGALSRNQYRPQEATSQLSTLGLNVRPVSSVIDDKFYFDATDIYNYPDVGKTTQIIDQLRVDNTTYSHDTGNRGDGASYSEKYKSDFGITQPKKIVEQQSIEGKNFSLLDTNKYGFDNDINEDGQGSVAASDAQLVWGRDDILGNPTNKFGIRTGLLHYTDALLKARGTNNSMNRTVNSFTDTRNNELHFNGTPFRQSHAGDQYATYQKAIRYQGNHIYGGSPDSTIYKRVIPKFHPTNEGNKNLMFSIENLAYLINSDGDTGIKVGSTTVKDATGKDVPTPVTLKLPKSEVGGNGGRLMWFMPYDLKIEESGIARYDNVQFVGRGEPLYTYNNSERTMNVSFMVLIDYPPQLIGKNHNEIAKFFALGGEAVTTNSSSNDLGKLQKEAADKDAQIAELSQVKTLNRSQKSQTTSNEISFYWRNDRPAANDVSIVPEFAAGYEDGDPSNESSAYGGDSGLNQPFLDDLTALATYAEEDQLQFFDIKMTASATQLHDAEYNKALSDRRIQAVITQFEQTFALEHKGKTPADFGMRYIKNSLGEKFSSTKGQSPSVMYDSDIKLERKTTIQLVPNKKTNDTPVDLTPDQVRIKNELIAERNALQTQINQAKKNTSTKVTSFVERNINDGISRGFKDMEIPNRKVVPAYHSYTPEDFSVRLTFLHQCLRQGNSIVQEVQSNGVPLVKNSAFGRPPFCVLRIGDFIHTKVVIENINFAYETPWDLNPEGRGMQPMIARIDMSCKIIGGQAMKSPVDTIQNAESFNWYANSTFSNGSMNEYGDAYSYAISEESAQTEFNDKQLNEKRNNKFPSNNTTSKTSK